MRSWERQERRTNNTKAELGQFLASRVLLVILSIILIAVLSAFTRDFSQKTSIDDEVLSLQDRITELEKERDTYLSMINYYDSEEYLTQQAKQKLDLMEEGESIVVISDDELEKYLAIELELENLKKLENSDIENSMKEGTVDDLENEAKIYRQFRLWWEYIF